MRPERPKNGARPRTPKPRPAASQPQRLPPRMELLARHGGRQLDPSIAVRFEKQRLDPTVYAGDRLLVRPTSNEAEIVEKLHQAADQNELDLSIDPIDRRLRQMARQAGITPEEAQPLLARVHLIPRWTGGPQAPPDAWPVLQTFRAMFGSRDQDRHAVQLDHLMTSAAGPSVTGTPFWKIPGTEGNPFWKIPGAGGFGEAGWGARTPVTWIGPAPLRCPDEWLNGRRRPVVAVVDTGVGEHDWLPDDIVDRKPTCGSLRMGLTDPATNPELTGVVSNQLTGALDADAGHGTFIAGLVRQTCPDANLLAVRVIQGDGVVTEGDLLEALNMLWLRQKLAMVQNQPDQLIDVVSLSLGYYHEQLTDAAFDPLLLTPLRALGALGVAVVTSAGNDATTRPMFPAAFAPYPDGAIKKNARDVLPVVSVGALNPDGSIAMFSNDGPWVRVWRPGASLVSTLPTTFDASGQPAAEVSYRGEVRATVDPDDFSSGFGSWSGTSFAAPILAGEVAQWLHTANVLSEDIEPATAAENALDHGWQALMAFVPRLRRPS